MTPYENLANAIVLRAVEDYRDALTVLEHDPRSRESLSEKASIERFFRSGWYGTLTDLDGEYLMTGVRRMVRMEVAA